MTPMKLLRTTAAVLVLALLGACNSAPKEPDGTWIRGNVEASSNRVLWRVTLLAMDKLGFPRSPHVDPNSLHCESGWKTQLQPFRGQGTRHMAVVDMTPVGDGTWDLKVRVKLQVNMTLAKPLDPTYAEWEWRNDDYRAAQVLLQHIKTYLPSTIEVRERPKDPLEGMLDPPPPR
jgi:hypothetical protein